MQDFTPLGGRPNVGSTQVLVLAAMEEEDAVDALEELLVPGAGLLGQTGLPPVVLKSCPAQAGT